jgi:hypothetical protein
VPKHAVFALIEKSDHPRPLLEKLQCKHIAPAALWKDIPAMHKPEGSFMKRALQYTVAVCGIVPVVAGLVGMILGASLTGDASGSADLDSHFRYLSGLLLGIGLAFWSTVHGIERKGDLFRLLTAFVVLGGFGRLLSIFVYDLPEDPMIGALVMELIVTPLLCYWQMRVASQSAGAGVSAPVAL